jgi:hypothetical protein
MDSMVEEESDEEGSFMFRTVASTLQQLAADDADADSQMDAKDPLAMASLIKKKGKIAVRRADQV